MNSYLLYKNLPGSLIKVLSSNDGNNNFEILIDVLATLNDVFILKLIPIDATEFYNVSIKINRTNNNDNDGNNYKKNGNFI